MIPASRALSRLALASGVAGLAALLLALSGCGGDTPAKAGGTSIAASAEAPPRRAAPAAPDGRCQQQVGAFLTAMETLRERLVAGLSYEEYVEEIELVRARYDEVPVDQLGLGCVLAAGTPGERAFGRYIDAANSWGACIGESGCDAPTIEPVLQKQWRVAARLLEEAQRGLRRA